MSSQKRKYELKARAEAQRATRERIAAAAAALHEEVGVARTTVADIARRAGVQRLTVYNHFPDLSALLPACSAHWVDRNPPPDLAPALALADPADRVEAVLAGRYAWYRRTRRMQRGLHGDRVTVPALDAWLAQSIDAPLAELTDVLSAGFATGRARAAPLVRLALAFWTWDRLAADGLDDARAAALMTEAVSGAAAPSVPDRGGRRR